MLRKLLIYACLFGTTAVSAQANKNTEKQADIDYKLTGAPMPKLLLVTYHDTSSTKTNEAGKETPPANKRHGKKQQDATTASVELAQEYVTNKDLDNNANLFVMMFNPTCSHCERVTETLTKNIALFKKSKIVLMANKVMKPYLPDFIKSFHIDNYPQIYTGTDSAGFVDKVFLYTALPQMNIYNGQRKLLKTYTGEVAIDSLKKYIE